jgi:hypothetical protein
MSNGQEPTDNQILAGFAVTLDDDLDALVSLREVLFLPPRPDQYAVDAVRRLDEAWRSVLVGRDARVTEIMQLNSSSLEESGLSGAELRLKMAVWRRARAAAVAEFEDSEDRDARSEALAAVARTDVTAEATFPRKLPRRLRLGLKSVSKMLGYADTIIGSLLRITGQFERFKELKETVEKLTRDVSEEHTEVT